MLEISAMQWWNPYDLNCSFSVYHLLYTCNLRLLWNKVHKRWIDFTVVGDVSNTFETAKEAEIKNGVHKSESAVHKSEPNKFTKAKKSSTQTASLGKNFFTLLLIT